MTKGADLKEVTKQSHANISGTNISEQKKSVKALRGENMLCLWLVWVHKEENRIYNLGSRQGPDHKGACKPM